MTYRITEELDTAGEAYYIAERREKVIQHGRERVRTYSDMFGEAFEWREVAWKKKIWVTITTRRHPTPELAREEAIAVVGSERDKEKLKQKEEKRCAEKRRRRNYHKVIGEFKL